MNKVSGRNKKSEEQVEVIFKKLSEQKEFSNLLLKSLEGVLHCKFTNNENGYVIKFSNNSLEVFKFEDFITDEEGSTEEKINTTILMKRDIFFLMTSGKLNPQIAMLSHKVSVEGDIKIAMYFFNLFN